MSDDERGKKRKVPPSPRWAVRGAPTAAQRLHASVRARADSRRRALHALGLSDDEGVLPDVGAWPLDPARRRARARRRRTRERVQRGGWCPEGSFEFECASPGEYLLGWWRLRGGIWRSMRPRPRDTPQLRGPLTPAADALRQRKAAVARLLRRVGAVARPTPPPVSTPQSRPDSPKRTPKAPKAGTPSAASSPGKPAAAPAEDEEKDPSASPKKGKKKKKKKKKATLANEGNPHHIDKCESPRPPLPHQTCFCGPSWPHGRAELTPDRPSRLPSYAWHASVLFPPSLRFLAARNRLPVRENEYVCFPCEVALYYASEASRRRAVSARFRALARFDPRLRRRRRKGRCTARRAEGEAGEEYDDEEYDDDEEYGDEGEDGEGGEEGHWAQSGGRCTCCLEPP